MPGKGKCGCRLVLHSTGTRSEFPFTARGWSEAAVEAVMRGGDVDLECGAGRMPLYGTELADDGEVVTYLYNTGSGEARLAGLKTRRKRRRARRRR